MLQTQLFGSQGMFFADLHVHSKYSIATAKNCSLSELARWAVLKGIRVVASGDFTHPQWRSEILDQLDPAEEGLFRLKKGKLPVVETPPGGFGPEDVRFVLNVEISSIYKRAGAVRKVHNLVFVPSFESMDTFSARMAQIGNIGSDGRPILGLDSRNLLEIALETDPGSYVIPAHIWTPWFSVLGSKSGFDSIEECFGDLADHIFALETGLSSDPEMNHTVRSLDPYTLVSNSDLHSPSRLGRECNIFFGEPSYPMIREALRAGAVQGAITGDADTGFSVTEQSQPAFIGTLEYFPEEGKYHYDGHRKCSMRLHPSETAKVGGRCPTCGGKITVGVMNRVQELAQQAAAEPQSPVPPFQRLTPLIEIISEALEVGPASKKALGLYFDTLAQGGPELPLLWSTPLAELSEKIHPRTAEGIARVRKGSVRIQPGYDGEYGVIEIFDKAEKARVHKAAVSRANTNT